MNYNHFDKAVELSKYYLDNGIGTYMEKSQHRILKCFFEQDTSFHEIPVDGFVADICKDDHIYEIQTSGFGHLTPKLEVFLAKYDVTVVYPCSSVNSIIWTNPDDGDVIVGSKRKSSAAKYKLLAELIHIYKYLESPKFKILVVETETQEHRLLDGRGKDRKIKATKIDKVPVDILSVTTIDSKDDIISLFDLSSDKLYTREDFRRKFQLKGRNLSKAIKTLRLMDIVDVKDKRDKKFIFYVKGGNDNDQSL